MLIIHGSLIQTYNIQIEYAQFIYFIDLLQPLNSSERQLLTELLQETTIPEIKNPLALVIPRLGTRSPWSSKATDILHICGLTTIKRIERGVAYYFNLNTNSIIDTDIQSNLHKLYDRMTESIVFNCQDAEQLFHHIISPAFNTIDILNVGIASLISANNTLGLALSNVELEYLYANFIQLQRNPTDVELMMFAQANSEHCRHKIFNAAWMNTGQCLSRSLFDMIRHTTAYTPSGVLSAYSDNAAVLSGNDGKRFFPDPITGVYSEHIEEIHILLKVETHNHPTAIAPGPGAATGVGGEIRDEAATGCGAKSKAGVCGFAVSHLHIPNAEEPWDINHGHPQHLASALQIMLDAPIGSAAFSNEFGRPTLAGFFRSFEMQCHELRGYHKPIMLAGGIGNIRAEHVYKRQIPVGSPLIVLGGPAMRIGLGGGAASSLAAGTSAAELDFASVQRANPEMQRRCQEVIDRCWAQGMHNPILSIHDVGAGGLSNAIPELVHGANRGGNCELRTIPNDDTSMSPLELWCNEAQERYVLALDATRIEDFKIICERERCPWAIVGEATVEKKLLIHDSNFSNSPIDVPMTLLFGNPPRLMLEYIPIILPKLELNLANIDILDAALRVLRFPTVADKTFLITIGDRSVGGLVARDQMVGPWQIPVADCAVTNSDYTGITGEAIAMGERPPLAIINAKASGRMAIGEAITNIAAARIRNLTEIKLSANWMAAAGYPGEDTKLYDTVQAVALELCPQLGLAIPVGKDSLSMRTVWQEQGQERVMTAPLSLIITAVAPVWDVRNTLTPQLRLDQGDTDLIVIDLGQGRNRLGGSCLAQVYTQCGNETPDVDDPKLIQSFFALMQNLATEKLILAYHDRSDGGLWSTLCEMAFAGHCGVNIDISSLGINPLAALFNEELGAVIQIRHNDYTQVMTLLHNANMQHCTYIIGTITTDDVITIIYQQRLLLQQSRSILQSHWSKVSFELQKLRDDPKCAYEAYHTIGNNNGIKLNAHLSFDPQLNIAAPYIQRGIRPAIAILREQGVNGQVEMAAAFHRAGFSCVDITTSDILAGRTTLDRFIGLAVCGGFSYGDVLGAGVGWAKSIVYNSRAREQFETFFHRANTFTLGVCNGCQMLAYLRDLIPGAARWPRFVRNRSNQFEARLCMVEVLKSPSILLQGMNSSQLPIVIAHGEGRIEINDTLHLEAIRPLITLRFIANDGKPAIRYPANPNGSIEGITGVTSLDGRVTILMPHPERLFRSQQFSWYPDSWGEDGPWLRLFRNARMWVE